MLAPSASLRGPMPDDCGDEIEALEVINTPEHTADGMCWIMQDGDLMLAVESNLELE